MKKFFGSFAFYTIIILIVVCSAIYLIITGHNVLDFITNAVDSLGGGVWEGLLSSQ